LKWGLGLVDQGGDSLKSGKREITPGTAPLQAGSDSSSRRMAARRAWLTAARNWSVARSQVNSAAAAAAASREQASALARRAQDVERAGDGKRRDRNAAGQRLDHDQAEGVGQAGKHEAVGGAVGAASSSPASEPTNTASGSARQVFAAPGRRRR
jgi:hypothetical protein